MASESQLENIINIITKYPLVSSKTVLNDNITEKNIMSLLFSNSFVSSDDALIKYILKEKNPAIAKNLLKNTIFYDYNFKIYKQRPIQNSYITDLDISQMNSQNIIKYYFLLDVLSQIYNNFTKPSYNNILTIRSRYFINNNDTISLYKKSNFFTFNIKYQVNEKDVKFVLDSVQSGINIKMVELMLNSIITDIQTHLTYIHISDINYKNYNYFKNIETFYKFCRLKLKYYTLLCLSELNPNINNYIDSILKYCFINLKKSMNILTDDSPLLLTNTLVTSKDYIGDINNIINDKKKIIKRNHNNSKKWDSKYFYTILYTTIIISFIILIVSFSINKIEFKSFSNTYIDIGLVLFIIAIYIIVSYIINSNTFEGFNNDNNLLKFPLQPMTSNTTIINNIEVRCKSSTVITRWGQVYNLFNHNKGDKNVSSFHTMDNYNRGNATKIYFTGYPGEVIMIDLGSPIILKQIGLLARSSQFKSRSPGVFRIYATNDKSKFDNNNYNDWDLIHDQISKIIDYKANISKIININNNKNYSIYALVVNKLSGNDNIVNFAEWELYGLLNESVTDLINESSENSKTDEIILFSPDLPLIPSELYTSSFENILQTSQKNISIDPLSSIQNNSTDLLRQSSIVNSSEQNITRVVNIENQNALEISRQERLLENYQRTIQNKEPYTNYNNQQILSLKNDINNRKKRDTINNSNTENAINNYNHDFRNLLNSKIAFTNNQINSEFKKIYKIFDDLNILKNEIDNALPKFDNSNDINIIEVDRLNSVVKSIYDKNQIDINLITKQLQNLFDRLLKEKREHIIFELAFFINNTMRQQSKIENNKQNIINEESNSIIETFISSKLSNVLIDERKIKEELEKIIDQTIDRINNDINNIYIQHKNIINSYLERITSIEILVNTDLLKIPNIVESVTKNIYPPLKNPISMIPINNNNNVIDVTFDNKTYRISVSRSLNRKNYVKNLIDQDLNTSWISSKKYKPEYRGVARLNNINTKGEWIIYSMPESFNLEEIIITSTNNRPRTWEVYGSNNTRVWNLITEASQMTPISEFNYQNNVYTKIFSKKEPYRNYAIIITSVIPSNNNTRESCSIADIRFKGNVPWLENSMNLKNQVLNSKKILLTNMLNLIRNVKILKTYVENLINISKKSFNPELELLQKAYELYTKFTSIQEYKYYNENNQNINIITRDLNKSLVENIQNITLSIANNIIISALKNEFSDMKEQKNFINVLEYRSSSDVHVTKHNNKFLIYTSYLILRIILFTCLLIIINRYLNIDLIFYYILIIGYIIIISIYVYDIIKNVRTKSSNIYWGKPDIETSLM